MQFGDKEQKLHLSVDDVRTAVDAMGSASTDYLPPIFQSLLIVAHTRQNPDLPPIDPQNPYIVFRLLIQIIGEELRRNRDILSITSLPDSDRESGLENIYQDVASDSSLLIGWSLLYYVYVRVDLNLRLEDYARSGGISARTTRRYRESAVKRLWENIVEREASTRRDRKLQVLLNSLPIKPAKLVGRDWAVQVLARYIDDVDISSLLITGAGGVGKTSLVVAALNKLIDSSRLPVERLIWVSNPSSIQTITNQIASSLFPHSQKIDVYEWLKIYPCIIVLDGVDRIYQLGVLSEVLNLLGNNCVIAICSVLAQTDSFDAYMHLKELDQLSAYQLIEHCLSYKFSKEQGITFNTTEIENIYKLTGGNPSAIRSVVPLWAYGDPSSEVDAVNSLLEQRIQQLSDKELEGWLAIALCSPDGIFTSDLAKIWACFSDNQILSVLIRNILVEHSDSNEISGKVFVTSVSRQYFMYAYHHSLQIKTLVRTLIIELYQSFTTMPDVVIQIIETILSDNVIEIPETIGQSIQNILASFNAPVDKTHAMIPDQECDDISTQLSVGEYYWNQHQYEAISITMRIVVQRAGECGDFISQARCYLLQGKADYVLGEYTNAYNALRRCLSLSRRLQLQSQILSATIYMMQIEIDRQNGHEVLRLFNDLNESMKHQSQVRIKYAEGLLLLSSSASNHEDTLKEVIDLLEKEVHLNNNQSSLVQVYTLKGRYYANRHDYNHAKAYFESALSCVDVESNPLMWGRSLSNLGAVLIKQGQNIEAHDLLVRAAEIQATINDTTGWAVTHNNLALIHNTSK